MEQARQWMWTKRKHGLSPHLQGSSYGDSWEELAFAEDAAGPLGGCIWPPRSYTCSFCRREFRSAQALGGHMNVHRRDRARLKQSPSPQNEILDLDHHHHHHQTHLPNPCSSFDVKYPSQVCTLVYNPNPNPNLDHGVLGSSSSSPSRVFVPPTQENCGQKITMVPPLYSSHVFQEQNKRASLSSPQSWSNLVADKYFQISDSRKDCDKKSNQESGGRAKGEHVKADLSVSLNLVVCHTFPIASEDEEETVSRKRRRTDTTLLPFFLKAGGSVDRHHDLQSKVLELSSSSINQDLDLELKL